MNVGRSAIGDCNRSAIPSKAVAADAGVGACAGEVNSYTARFYRIVGDGRRGVAGTDGDLAGWMEACSADDSATVADDRITDRTGGARIEVECTPVALGWAGRAAITVGIATHIVQE